MIGYHCKRSFSLLQPANPANCVPIGCNQAHHSLTAYQHPDPHAFLAAAGTSVDVSETTQSS